MQREALFPAQRRSRRQRHEDPSLLIAVNDPPSSISLQPTLSEPAIDTHNAPHPPNPASSPSQLTSPSARSSTKEITEWRCCTRKSIRRSVACRPKRSCFRHFTATLPGPSSPDGTANPTHTHIRPLTERPRSISLHTPVWPMPRTPGLHRHHHAAAKASPAMLGDCHLDHVREGASRTRRQLLCNIMRSGTISIA